MLLKKSDTKLWLYYLVQAYGLVNKTGLLKLNFIRPVFEGLYFFYKNLTKDPLKTLTKHHPEMFKNGHMLDIGANIGYTVSVLAPLADNGFKVFTFEPEKDNYNSLSKRFSRNDSVITNQLAVGNSSEMITLFHNTDSHADHRVLTDNLSAFLDKRELSKSYQVPCVSIDDFLSKQSIAAKHISFIKIDVQGFEVNVIEGMKNTLRDNPNITIMMEFDKSALKDLGFEPETLLDMIIRLGFNISLLSSNGQLTPVNKDILLSDKYNHHTDLVLTKPTKQLQ